MVLVIHISLFGITGEQLLLHKITSDKQIPENLLVYGEGICYYNEGIINICTILYVLVQCPFNTCLMRTDFVQVGYNK